MTEARVSTAAAQVLSTASPTARASAGAVQILSGVASPNARVSTAAAQVISKTYPAKLYVRTKGSNRPLLMKWPSGLWEPVIATAAAPFTGTTYTLDTVNHAGIINGVAKDITTGAWSNPHTAGKIAVQTSTLSGGSYAVLVNRTMDEMYTSPVANSWMQIDFDPTGINRRVKATDVSLRQRDTSNNNLFRSIRIDGSIDGTNWTELKSVTSGITSTAGQWTDFSGLTDMIARYIRVTQTNYDSSGNNYFCLGELEVFGTVNGDVYVPPALPAYASLVMASSPWAYWRCTETAAPLVDMSGNARNLTTVTGSPTYAATGPIDKAINWGTSTRISGTNATSPSTVTLEAVVKLTATPTNATGIIDFADTGNRNTTDKNFYIDTAGKLTWFVYTGSNNSLTSSTALPLNQWVHVAATVGPAGMYIYQNGVQVAGTAGVTTSYTGAMAPWLHGGAAGTSVNLSVGSPLLIAEPAIYTTQLSAATLLSHAQAVP